MPPQVPPNPAGRGRGLGVGSSSPAQVSKDTAPAPHPRSQAWDGMENHEDFRRMIYVYMNLGWGVRFGAFPSRKCINSPRNKDK